MTSYFSSILTNTSSRYKSLRQSLFSDEADGDTEHDTHISRVLRAYYIEKGRPFPPWLPPDPKGAPPPQAQYSSGGGRFQNQLSVGRASGRGLSDLWDSPKQQHAQEPTSLRRAAPPRGAPARTAQGRFGAQDTYDGASAVSQISQPSQASVTAAQRAGGYQSTLAQRPPYEPGPPSSSSTVSTAQEKLKARLWGSGRSGSSGSVNAAYNAPQAAPGLGPAGPRMPYERGGNYRSGSNVGPPYPDDRGGYDDSGGAGGRQQAANGVAGYQRGVGSYDRSYSGR